MMGLYVPFGNTQEGNMSKRLADADGVGLERIWHVEVVVSVDFLCPDKLFRNLIFV